MHKKMTGILLSLCILHAEISVCAQDTHLHAELLAADQTAGTADADRASQIISADAPTETSDHTNTVAAAKTADTMSTDTTAETTDNASTDAATEASDDASTNAAAASDNTAETISADMTRSPDSDSHTSNTVSGQNTTECTPESPAEITGNTNTPSVNPEAAARTARSPAGVNKETTYANASALTIDEMISNSINWTRRGNDMLLNETFFKSVSSTYTDWKVFNLGRLGIADNYTGFLSAADLYVRSQYAAHPQTGLSKDASTATEAHRLSMAVLAAGGDPTHIGGQNLIADGTYSCLTGEPWKQGVNGAAWALIAMDSRGFVPPANAAYDRKDMIDYLLSHEISGGGWAVDPASRTPKADITGAVVTALAPYYAGNPNVQKAVDHALNFFRKKMNSDGYLEDSESTAWAVTAYVSLGIDPGSIKSSYGKSLLDGLTGFYNDKTGGFFHIRNGFLSSDMATDQVVYSLIAYQRFLSGSTNLFDFRSPANTSQYIIRADGTDYMAEAGTNGEIVLPPGTSSIQITNLPIGSYDAAVVTAGGKTFASSYRREDGSTPVNGQIPAADGSTLSILVNRQNGTSETWHLFVQMNGNAKVQAVKHQIAFLPDPDSLQLSDEASVNRAKEAYDALTSQEKKEVTNYSRLQKALEKIQNLKQKDQEKQNQKRKELKKKMQTLKTPVKISDKVSINRYLLELEELQDWSEQAAWKSRLEKYLQDISKREAAVKALDQDIWEQISPLWVSQKDRRTIKTLMTRYAGLSKEEQALLKNRSSLLDAAGIIDSLSDAVIPAKVFTNIRTTKGSFTYTGKLKSAGTSYTLTFDGRQINAAKNVDARVRCPDAGSAENALACIKFLHNGSLNGTAVFQTKLNVADGTYHLYWYNKDKKAVQSAGSAQVKNSILSMEITRGGKYWLSTGIVRLSSRKPASPQTTGPQTTPAPAGSTSTARPASAAPIAAGNPSATQNSTGQSEDTEKKTILAKGRNGIIKASEFQQIIGKDRNLKIKDTMEDGTRYTLTFHGEDVTTAADFPYEIKSECENSTYMRQLGDQPLILCMENMDPFPGNMLVTLHTDLEDDTYLLFSYDPEEMKAEYVKKAEISNGRARFILSGSGDYFIAKRAKAGSLLDAGDAEDDDLDFSASVGEPENTELPAIRSKSFPAAGIWKWILAAVLGLGAGGSGTYFYKKKKEGIKIEKK